MRQLVISQSITPREYKSLDKYFNEIEKIGLICITEEVTLAQKIRLGDHEALERLTKTNLRFVVSVAKQYQNQGISLCDLINEGNLGLMTAARRYDETKGFKFISYAVWWIRQAITASIAEHARTVRLPYNQLGYLSRIYRAMSELEQLHARRPTAEELAEHLEMSVENVLDLISKSGNSVSLDEPYREDGEHTLLDVIHTYEYNADDRVMFDSISKDVEACLKILSKRERELITLYYGLSSCSPQSLEEIGKKFKITKEHVGRLKEKALYKLRCCSYAPILKSYLG
jgi:RNA polymerase primary sigma factor